MSVSYFDFIFQLSAPRLCVVVVLTLAVILVNGWTDAPNAIATAVSTGALSFRAAVRLAAVCNLLGVVFMTAVNASVAETIYSIVDFGGKTGDALTALCAALTAIVLWATAAWFFGIPTSESHALVAGVSGAALALQGGFSNLHFEAWGKVLWGLALSVGLGYLLGVWCLRLLLRLLPKAAPRAFRRLQVAGAALMAFLHGAQDGQKFIGVFLLGVALAQGRTDTETFLIPLWLMVLCALVMALGTSIGGKRIIDTVGRDMVSLDPRQGFAADLAGGVCLLASTVMGLPVSTTHTKTAAILGAGAAAHPGQVNRRVARSIVLTWVFTFPGCGLVGYFTARVFLLLFS
ncbi:MAG: inorganic phosphate transporter [Clostridia bacterium]|nr:inorganic phosphate transporter [Clostridia bacterium]